MYMSAEEKNLSDNNLPHKLSKQEIIDSFNNDFDIQRIDDNEFRGSLEFYPKSLFTVLKKKSS